MITSEKIMIQLLPESDKRIRLYILLAVAAIAGLFLFLQPGKKTAPAPGYQATTPATNLPKYEIKSKIKVYPKEMAKKKLKIPDEMTPDGTEIIASAEIPPSEGGHTAVTVLDIATGDAAIKISEKARPWFALGGQTEVGAGFGIGTKGEQLAAYIRQDVLRIGKIHLIAQGDAVMKASGEAEARGMINVAVRW